jgi:simple sugar transport system ATP-binding protein
VGAGKTELCKTLFGALAKKTGSVSINKKELNINSPYDAVNKGIALVPEERRKRRPGDGTVYSNLSAANLKKFSNILSFVSAAAERSAARHMITDLASKPRVNIKSCLPFRGNQQKWPWENG